MPKYFIAGQEAVPVAEVALQAVEGGSVYLNINSVCVAFLDTDGVLQINTCLGSADLDTLRKAGIKVNEDQESIKVEF